MTSKEISMTLKEISTYEGRVRRLVSNQSSAHEGLHNGGEETEIAAHIAMPTDGGWAWVILGCSFISVAIIDGICFTFGAVIDDMAKDLNQPMSLVGLISSLQVSTYFLASPIAAALINKHGFRASLMSSSITVSLSLVISYLSKNFGFLCFFYGLCIGIGACILNLAANLSVGFYFEKYRTITLSIAGTGSSFGVMAFFPVNAFLTKLSGWRSTTLFQSGLCGIVYFLGLTYRPLLSFTVTIENENVKETTRTVTMLPSLAKASTTVQGGFQSTLTERALRVVSNVHFPTAGAMVSMPEVAHAGPSEATVQGEHRFSLRPNTPSGTISLQQLKQVQTIIQAQNQDKPRCSVDLTRIKVEQPNKRGFCSRLFHWEPHVKETRPMYRVDAFYQGRLQDLPEYQKSVLNADVRSRTGLEYQLAVTRAVTVNDIQEKRGVFTKAVRRVLASMLDPTLLKKRSFLLLCFNGWLCNLGYLIPLVFLKDKNEKAGIDPTHCSLFVSAIGFMNGVGRVVIGFLAIKVDPLKMYITCVIANGVSTLCCPFMRGVYLQYVYAMMFGFTAGGKFGMRNIVIVKIYGLEKLTNGMGIILLFLGIGNLVSVPVGGVLEDKYGYDVSFYYSGFCVFLSGVILFPLQKIVTWENMRETSDQSSTPTTPPPPPPTLTSSPSLPPLPSTTSPDTPEVYQEKILNHHGGSVKNDQTTVILDKEGNT